MIIWLCDSYEKVVILHLEQMTFIGIHFSLGPALLNLSSI